MEEVSATLCRDCQAEADRAVDELSASDRVIFFAFYSLREEVGEAIDARQLLDSLDDPELRRDWAVEAIDEALGRLNELELISLREWSGFPRLFDEDGRGEVPVIES